MANPEHVEVARKGSEAIAEWRRANRRRRLDVSGADLRRVDLIAADLSRGKLIGADFSEADLSVATLIEADLAGATLRRARLYSANLYNANLSRTTLMAADLTWADLREANLASADLSWAHLSGVRVTRADFSEAALGWTSLSNVDLSQVIGLAAASHDWPSTVGVDTLIRSFRGAGDRLTPELETFFRGAGVPQGLLEALPRILAEVKYCSCFIAYGQPDVEFARKLCEDLEGRGVSCWLYDMDATPGDRTWREIGRRRREAEKMVVLCSAGALVRDGVLKEIEELSARGGLDDRTIVAFTINFAPNQIPASFFASGRSVSLARPEYMCMDLTPLREHCVKRSGTLSIPMAHITWSIVPGACSRLG